MIQNIRISNFALINKLEIKLNKGLNIITGETGAGKSVIIGALSLLLGDRFDKKVHYDENKKCVLELDLKLKGDIWAKYFESLDVDFYEDCIIRREILPNGRSRSFINDTPVLINTLKQIRSRLIDIHEQHQVLELYKASFQLKLIDGFGDTLKDLKVFQNHFHVWNEDKDKLEKLIADQINIQKEKDYLQYLFDELENTDLNQDILKLESEYHLLENAVDIKNNLQKITFSLSNNDGSLISQLENCQYILKDSTEGLNSFEELNARLSSLVLELKDVTIELENKEATLEYDPERKVILENSIDQLNQLLTKHSLNETKDLIQLKSDLQLKLTYGNNLDSQIEEIKQQVNKKENELRKLAEGLSEKRQQAIYELEKKVNSLLKEVGIPYGQIKIKKEVQDILTKGGQDQVSFYFSPDDGNKFLPLQKIASGGELSRMMLCLKFILSNKILLPCMIMDEIDTGVSGEVAKKVGKLLESLSKNAQLICISHLPQIAGKGQTHFHVFKQKDDKGFQQTCIRELKTVDRINELAKMLSGDKPSQSAISNAEELLSN